MYDDVNQFDLLCFHTVQLGDKTRKVNCVRDSHEPVDNCPLCANGSNTITRFFIKLLEYVKEGDQIVVKPKVWERSIAYAKQLSDLMNEYGPLTENIFKVKRNGAAGSRETTYSIMYANQKVYDPSIYVYRPELFENYFILGTIVADKSKEELLHYVQYGSFPQVEQPQQTQQVQYQQPQYQQVQYSQPVMEQQVQQPMRQTPWAQQQMQQQSMSNVGPGMVPPKRTY